MQQEPLQAPMLSWNVDPLKHWFNGPNSYQGNFLYKGLTTKLIFHEQNLHVCGL